MTRRSARDQRGEATTEMVLAVPVLMVLILTVIQFGLWYHAVQVAEDAAQEGARTARVHGGTADGGRNRASGFMAVNAPRLVEEVAVNATRDANHARVEVRGRLRSLVPGLVLQVQGTADSPTERFRAP